ncbi:MAG: hypothetical protein ACTSR0_00950 [Candidatus Asgardarchaeia archaeon]
MQFRLYATLLMGVLFLFVATLILWLSARIVISKRKARLEIALVIVLIGYLIGYVLDLLLPVPLGFYRVKMVLIALSVFLISVYLARELFHATTRNAFTILVLATVIYLGIRSLINFLP